MASTASLPAPNIVIIGPGRLGKAVEILARRAGWTARAVSSRQLDDAAALCPKADLILITTSDDVIGSVCARLFSLAVVPSTAVVAHCSGALTSDILRPDPPGEGAPFFGSFHPMQTFPTVEAAVEKLPGSWCFCEGDEKAREFLFRLGRDLGCPVASINKENKVLYHVAAVMACNYLTALQAAALSLAEAAGLDESTARAALAPLVEATASNVARLGTAEALTGPIRRGDQQTVASHVVALKKATQRGEISDQVIRLYGTLGRWTVELCSRNGFLSAEEGQAIDALLLPCSESRPDEFG